MYLSVLKYSGQHLIEAIFKQQFVLSFHPGVPFTQVFASDRDDPETANARLSYSLVSQIPNKNNIPLFQIDRHTGEISLTAQGNSTHGCADRKPNTGVKKWVHQPWEVSNLSISACNPEV